MTPLTIILFLLLLFTLATVILNQFKSNERLLKEIEDLKSQNEKRKEIIKNKDKINKIDLKIMQKLEDRIKKQADAMEKLNKQLNK